ncbi:MAG: hypothetical protein HN389_03330 [Clostridia bacterium]|nr:hypothetical protein [Clostridia bacterium]
MLKLIEDVINKLPILKQGNLSYCKLIDLQNSLFKIETDDIEISNCSLTPNYLDINGTYEIYHQELKLNLVNEPMFEKYIYMLFRKHSNEIAPYFLKLHTTCFVESILPNKSIKVSNIVKWIDYVIGDNSNDEDMLKTIKKHFNDECFDINKLYIEILIHNEKIYSID